MATPRIPMTRSSLIKPLEASDLLIDGEFSLYNERLHWATLIRPFLETLGMLITATVLAGAAAGRPFNALSVFLLLAAAVYLYLRLKTLRADQKKSARNQRTTFYASVLLLVLILARFGPQAAAIVGMIMAVIRFVFDAMMWLLYERLLITNRRVILARGFLGSDISMMPLTRVTDINYNTTVTGEFLGYAEIRVETAGQDQAFSWLRFLEKPATFYETLIELSTAAVGSVTKRDATGALFKGDPREDEHDDEADTPIQGTEAHLGTLDEGDGTGTRTP